MKAKTNGNKALVVTTAHRGVFFGYGSPTADSTIRITQARMCVYWSVDVKSVLGLASNGPSANCKVGPAVPAMILREVTSVMEASEEAAKRWELAPWK